MKATFNNGTLRTLNDKCVIAIPNFVDFSGLSFINLKIMPEISMSGAAKFNDETVIGRGAPIKTYANTDNRVLNMKLTFFAATRAELIENSTNLYLLRSALYPSDGALSPYIPPPVCQINCGQFISKNTVCAVLENLNEHMPTDVVWDDDLLIPYYFTVDTTWHLVYASTNLPNQNKILANGA
jgi:hypothetical protein